MLSPEHYSAQMSKITSDGLTWSGTRCCAHLATVGVKGLTYYKKNFHHRSAVVLVFCETISLRKFDRSPAGATNARELWNCTVFGQ